MEIAGRRILFVGVIESRATVNPAANSVSGARHARYWKWSATKE